MPLPLCRLALDEPILSQPASDSHTLSHENSQEEEEEKYKDLVSTLVVGLTRVLRSLLVLCVVRNLIQSRWKGVGLQ